MTGTTRTSADLPAERRRALIRAWRRGTREMDLVLGSFADLHLATLTQSEFAEFEQILLESDPDLMKWVTGETATPAHRDTPLFRRICESPRATEA